MRAGSEARGGAPRGDQEAPVHPKKLHSFPQTPFAAVALRVVSAQCIGRRLAGPRSIVRGTHAFDRQYCGLVSTVGGARVIA